MAVSAYSVAWAGPEVIERGQAQSLTCPVYLDTAQVTPTSWTLTVYDGSNTAQLSTSGSGAASYSWTPATSLTCAAGWRVEWALTIAGQVHTFRRDAVLVFRRLYMPEIQDALAKRHPELSRRLTPTNLVGIATEAWLEIEGKLIAEGRRPWLILSGPAFREPLVYLALSMIFRDLSEGNTQSNEWMLAEKYEATYLETWRRTTFLQASESDGTPVDTSRRRSTTSQLWLCGKG